MSRDTPPAATVSALKRGMAVLNCFTGGVRALSNAELAQMTGLPKPTVARLAATLVSLGLLRQDPETEKYALAAGVLTLAQAFLSGLDVREHARPHLRRLADECGGSTCLGIHDAGEIVLIDAFRARGALVSLRLEVGARLPLATSALGRAYLWALDEEERVQILNQSTPGASDSARLKAGVDKALQEGAMHGHCTSLGELRAQVNSVATALRLPDGQIFAVNCGGPSFAFAEARLREEIAPRLIAAARAIANEIGASLPGEVRRLQPKAA